MEAHSPEMPKTLFDNGFVLNPDQYYSPLYRISPFQTSDISRNLSLADDHSVLDKLDEHLGGNRWVFTTNGKSAIRIALEAIAPCSDDCVTILTTSGNRYISGCVTREIENICSWSRNIESNTVAIFVNHEFGFPYRDLSSLRNYGFPIIEDACHSFLADTSDRQMGKIGDFVIYSLPKIFPVQMGGILSFKNQFEIDGDVNSDSQLYRYLSKVLSYYWPTLEDARADRRKNHERLVRIFSKVGCIGRFEVLENDVPGAFLFRVPSHVDLDIMKKHGWKHGIECSVFYGEQTFFIPVHQRLTEYDFEYFFHVFSACMRSS